jgi:hypothetical protein
MSDETLGALAAALAKAQGAMANAAKDKSNPHFKSRYADLASVWDACRDALSANGLAVVQLVSVADKASVAVETRLLHASGQSLSSMLALPVAQPTAQGIGSAITYARRYALAAMVGVAPDEDDDGNEASRPAAKAAPTPPAPASTPPAADSGDVERWVERFRAAPDAAALQAAGLELAKSAPKAIANNPAVREAYNARHRALGGGK